METTLSNADLRQLSELLQTQQVRKHDIVAPATRLHAAGGDLLVEGAEAIIDATGVTQAVGRYTLTDVFVEGLADKLRVPLAYLRRLQTERPDLFDANVNGWLHGGTWGDDDGAAGVGHDSRSFLVRTFQGDDGGPGIARAFLSDRYGAVDHLDALMAALAGVRESGVEVQMGRCDLTNRRMYVKVHAPSVGVAAPELLAGYRSPFSGNTGADNPLVFAGFVLTNSEVGNGSWTIVPQLTVQICGNGMTMTKDMFRKVHLGGRLDAGTVRWSEDTKRRTLELVTAQARDVVATFLDVEYVRRKVAELAELAGREVTKPEETIRHVATKLAYTDQQREDVFRMFIEGGQATAGGVMGAVTAAAQIQANPDTTFDMEADAVPALELAAAYG